MEVLIKKTNNPNEKYDAVIADKKEKKRKTVAFGQAGASDYAKHKDEEREDRYVARPKKNENWEIWY